MVEKINPELLQRLTNSEAVLSLGMEASIHQKMVKAGWNTIRSPYYHDKQTDKYREMDIIASCTYEGLARRNIALLTELSLLVECKTLAGYHIIVDGEMARDKSNSEMLQHFWWGYELDFQPRRLVNLFDQTTLSTESKAQTIEELRRLLYPNDRMLYKGRIPDPPILASFTAFREMNIGATKELENSVLWKAFIALNSAGESFGINQWERVKEDILYLCNELQPDFKNIFKGLTTSLFFQVLNKYINIHKILVIDADIWMRNTVLTPIPYFRFWQCNVYGHLKSWIDVVNFSQFDSYIKLVTGHYNKFYKKTALQKTK